MKKLFVIALAFLATTAAFAQKDTTAAQKDTTAPKPVPTPTMMSNTAIKHPASTSSAAKPAPKDWSKVSLANRANDHLMVNFGYEAWAGRPDTVAPVPLPPME